MSELIIGTDEGAFRFAWEEKTAPEEGPASVAFLTVAWEGAFAITREGALWQRTCEGNWRLVNQRPVADEVWAMGADPRQPGRVYLGVSPALLYRSDDGGATWRTCDSVRRIPGYERWTFPPPPHIPHVRSIAPDPQVVGAVYIGVEEGGIYRSPDGGETWESLNEGLYWDIHRIVPAPDGDKLYATTGDGFYRSDDGGLTWRHIMTGLDRDYTIALAASPQRPGLLYTAAAAGPPPSWLKGPNVAFYRSNDSGEHWSKLEAGLPPRIDNRVEVMVLDEEGSVYAAAGKQIFASRDEGETWQLVATDLPTVRSLAVV